nr:sugar nucleotide-binding protein [Fervidobacterium sp.]
MKVLVTGADGQLGFDVVKELKRRNIDFYGTIKDFDLTNEKATKNFILDYKPDVVIHCAAYTAVDKAQEEREFCYEVNILGTRYIAEAVAKLGAKIIYKHRLRF